MRTSRDDNDEISSKEFDVCYKSIQFVHFSHKRVYICRIRQLTITTARVCVLRGPSQSTRLSLTTGISLRPRYLPPSLSKPIRPSTRPRMKSSSIHPKRRSKITWHCSQDDSSVLLATSFTHTTVQVRSHFCGQASSLPQAPTMEQKISPLGQSPWVCSSLMSPSTKMLSHSWNLQIILLALPSHISNQSSKMTVSTHLPQFNGSTKVPGLSQTKGLQDFPPFLRTLLKGLSPLLPCRSESRQGSEHAQGCTQAIWLGQ
jgi:hypothetical protein